MSNIFKYLSYTRAHLTTRQLFILVCTNLFSICLFGQNQIGLSAQNQIASEHLASAYEIRFNYPDSAEQLYKLSYQEFLDENDSTNAIYSKVGLSAHLAHNASYALAYDGYWEALIMADHLNDQGAKATVYNGLGWLYSLFERKELAENYFNQSLSLFKSIEPKDDVLNQAILDNYYALATLFRKSNDNQLARTYLDSCEIMQRVLNQEGTGPFTGVERAYVLYNEKKYQESLAILKAYQPYFDQELPSYLVILLSSMGDVYSELGDLKLAEANYLKSLSIGDRYKSHQDVVPVIHERLANLYIKLGEPKKAYQNLLKSKELNEEQFGSKSENNQRMLEIKDDFRRVKQEQDHQIQEQKLADLEQKEEINRLTNVLLYGMVIFLVLAVFITYRFLRNRYKARRMVLQKENELKIEKAKEVLEVKNKELTVSALQVIEKDELLAHLKEQLNQQRKNPDQNTINRLARSIDLNHARNWEDFNARFTSVNHKFYDNLADKYPQLSQGDKKICALIKLNFSSKDMARLLGISVESVHTTRYRLRRKLKLERQDNLEEHIAMI